MNIGLRDQARAPRDNRSLPSRCVAHRSVAGSNTVTITIAITITITITITILLLLLLL